MGLGEIVARAGWRVGMFGGVVVGGLLAAFVVPTSTGAQGTAGALSGSELAQVRILPLARPAVHVLGGQIVTITHRPEAPSPPRAPLTATPLTNQGATLSVRAGRAR